MFLNPSFFMFLSTLSLGSFLAISAPTWFSAWVGLELNMMSFIPLIAINMSPFYSESALKYFLIQALGSTLIIIATCLLLTLPTISSYLILLSLLLKLGSAPFHFWLPQIMEGLTWPQIIILMSIQKLAPMILISYFVSNHILIKIIIFSSIFSALVGAIGGFNNTKLRKIMAFSSINHMAWMLMSLLFSNIFWLIYFSFYVLISTSVALMFHMMQAFNLSDLMSLNHNSILSSINMSMSLLSLGGLPPFTGFIPKWILVQILLKNEMFIPLFFLLSSALMTLYFYLRIMMMYILPVPSMNYTMTLIFNKNFSTLPMIFLFSNLIGMFMPFLFILL